MTTNTSTDPSARTFSNEDRLPRVPLPGLEESAERFLEWCGPLLGAQELAATEQAVAAFLRPGGPARTLHAALQEYDAGAHSWLDDFWRRRYLGRRDRIALNANFFFLLQDGERDQVVRAAGLVAAAVAVQADIAAERVPPLVQQGRALSMEQLKYVFAACRIPGPVQDTVRSAYSEQRPGPPRERHVVVLCRGSLFRMDVIGPRGVPHTPDELAAGLRAVRDAAPAEPGTSVGHLTTGARAQWAANRDALIAADAGNAALLDTVETALFLVCLEDAVPADEHAACDQLLHGDSANRWFDKPLSFVVFGDGTAGINVEHCELDGTTVLNVVDAICAEPPEEHARRSGAHSQGLPAYEPLRFRLDDSLRVEVQAAGESFAAYADDTATRVLAFDDVGVEPIKRLKMSPDAFVQMAYQLAHARSRGRIGATYESIATRHFRHGRTEAMRVVTPEIVRFVAAMDDPAADEHSRRAAFRAAAVRHVERAKDGQAGRAPEQHLWELQLLQERSGEALQATGPLELHASPGWTTMRDDVLSTSSAPSANIRFFGFGSTGPRCIGVAYVLLPERFALYLSSPQPLSAELAAFAEQLPLALEELRALLVAEQAEGEAPRRTGQQAVTVEGG